jgi:hypothetical protein
MADGIQFDEEQQYQQSPQADKKPFFIRLVLKTGIVSDDRQAEYILLGFVAIVILISIYIAIPNTPKGTIQHKLGDELRVPGALTR